MRRVVRQLSSVYKSDNPAGILPSASRYSSYWGQGMQRGKWSCPQPSLWRKAQKGTWGCVIGKWSGCNDPCWAPFRRVGWDGSRGVWGIWLIYSIRYWKTVKRKTNEPKSTSPDNSSSRSPCSPLAPVPAGGNFSSSSPSSYLRASSSRPQNFSINLTLTQHKG